MKRVLILLGTSKSDSFCGEIANNYFEGAQESGCDVSVLKLSELKFDPILWEGYNKIQKLEPDLKKAQELIKWADHIIFIFPTWWGSLPALFKGFIDRIFLPNFAFKYKSKFSREKLLKGKTAQIITTMDAPRSYYTVMFRSPGVNLLKRAVLEFCGVKVKKVHYFDKIRFRSEKSLKKLLAKAYDLGSKI